MKKLANVLVNSRYVLLLLFLFLTALSVFLIPRVNINTDMTKYLPESSQMSRGIEVMKQAFPDTTFSQNEVKIMIDDLSEKERTEMSARLSEWDYVDSVAYDVSSDDYNSGEHALYVLSVPYDFNTAEMDHVIEEVEALGENYELTYATNNVSGTVDPIFSGILVVVVLVIMLIMCGSWAEPFIFLLTIGIAIVINMGTNAFLGSVSSTTNGIASMLQLVLSMDYSIILSNRFRQASKETDDRVQAMKTALAKAIPAVLGSAFTTIVGLLALVFMSFTIGADIGIVLAKGVFCSLICVITVLPALMLLLDKLVIATSKKTLVIPARKLAKVSYGKRYVISVAFVLLCISAFFFKDRAGISYDIAADNEITSVFPETGRIILLYENEDEEKMPELTRKLESLEGVYTIYD